MIDEIIKDFEQFDEKDIRALMRHLGVTEKELIERARRSLNKSVAINSYKTTQMALQAGQKLASAKGLPPVMAFVVAGLVGLIALSPIIYDSYKNWKIDRDDKREKAERRARLAAKQTTSSGSSHRYTRKEMKNGKWVYYYKSEKMNIKDALDDLIKAEARGLCKDKPLNKPFRNPTGSQHKKVVCVKKPNGNVKTVKYGHRDYKHNYSKDANDNFRARHNCSDKKDKTKAGYWACKDLWPTGKKKGTGKTSKSEENMKDLFKSLGIRVGESPESLLDTTSNVEIQKSMETGMDNSRMGQGPSARDMLEYHLFGKSFDLKETHGECCHTDNDKDMEKYQSTVEEIKDGVKRKDAVDVSRKPGHSEEAPRVVVEKEADGSMTIINRSSNDINFMKAMGWLDDIEKGMADRKPESTKDDSYSTRGEGSEAKKEVKKEEDEEKKEKFQGGEFDSEVAEVEEAEKSELDKLYDLFKAKKEKNRCWEGYEPVPGKKPYSEDSCRKKKSSHVKKSGPGGMIFDFGKTTGNPIADNFTRALNMFPEPQQESIIRAQEKEHENALEKFVTKGEREYTQEAKGMTDDGSVHPEMEKALSGSFDEQTAKAIQDGHIKVVEGFVPEANKTQKSGAGELNISGDGPAIINEYNSEEITLGGEVIKATSETDMALLQQMKSSGLDQRDNTDGMVIDASAGDARNVVIDAVSGEVIE